MSENTVKNVMINRVNDADELSRRLEAIQHVMGMSSHAGKISLRIYKAKEDAHVIVEKWTFADSKTRKEFTESDGIALGPWPHSSHDHELGPLTMDSETLWEE